jgi:uncharacterized protein YqeY
MGLKEQILEDIKAAMREKNQDKVATLRFVQAAIKNKEIEVRPNEITDQDVAAVLKKLAKQRKDSIEQYQKGGREDLVAKESAELAFLEVYLPKPLSREEMEALVKEAINETGASSMKDMGGVIKATIAKSQGRADNKTVSEIARGLLQ